MDARELKDKATQLFTKGKFVKAAETYEVYCAADKKDHQARLRCGDAWAKAGKKDKAVGAYALAAEGFARDGFLPRAIAASKLVLELDPTHTSVQKMLADLYAQKRGAPAARPASPSGVRSPGGAPEVSRAIEAPGVAAGFAQRKDALELEAPAPSKPPPAAPAPAPVTKQREAIELPEYELPIDAPAVAAQPKSGHQPTQRRAAIELELSPDEGAKAPPAPPALEATAIEIELGSERTVTGEVEIPIEGQALPDADQLPAELQVIPPAQQLVASVAVELPPPAPSGPAFELTVEVEAAPAPAPAPPPAATPSAVYELTETVESAPAAPVYELDDDDESLESAELLALANPVAAPPPPPPAAAPSALPPAVTAAPAPPSIAPALRAPAVAEASALPPAVEAAPAPPSIAPALRAPAVAEASALPPAVEASPAPPSIAPIDAAPPGLRPRRAGEGAGEPPRPPAPPPHPVAEGEEPATDLERGLKAFMEFDPDAPPRPAPAAPPAALPPPPPPAVAAGFTELDLEGDSLLHAVEAAAAAVLPEAPAAPAAAEEAMEAPEEPRVEPGALPKIPLFSDLPADAFIALFEECPLLRFDKGQLVFEQGDKADALFVICAGKARVFRTDAGGARKDLVTLDEGSFFGELALLSEAPRSASVEAAEDDTQVLSISAETLKALSTRFPVVATALKKFSRQRMLTNLLNNAALFAPFSRGDRRDLVQKFRAREARRGEVLLREGQPSDGLYVVLYGEVEVEAKGRRLATLKEGEVFGEISLLQRSPATATVRATRHSSLLRLPKGDFDMLILSHPQVLEHVAELVDERLKANAATEMT